MIGFNHRLGKKNGFKKRSFSFSNLSKFNPFLFNLKRIMGMGVSLFEWLDSKEGSIELVQQYRMNKYLYSHLKNNSNHTLSLKLAKNQPHRYFDK
jgi:hypothetical protein